MADAIDLPPCNPTKLGLALNYSIFQYEIMNEVEYACRQADDAIKLGLEKLDEVVDDDYRDAKSIIDLLKENLAIWKEELGEDKKNTDV